MSSQEDVNIQSPIEIGKDVFEPKQTPKIIRVLTVMAYVLSVSMAAILLSIYYIFMWQGQPHIGARRAIGHINQSTTDMGMNSPERQKTMKHILPNHYTKNLPESVEESEIISLNFTDNSTNSDIVELEILENTTNGEKFAELRSGTT